MYNFVTGSLVLFLAGFGFYEWEWGGWFGNILGPILLGAAFVWYLRWERRLFGE
jgi:hypothetical protein